jgi:sporulation protein YlmC with PRC-barrel domain
MKYSLKNLIGYSIDTSDGMKGKIKDFLFDEDNWAVRFIDIDFGSFFKDKRVLLPIDVINNLPWNDTIQLNISKAKIENSPAPEDIPTISREYEKKLIEYYGYPVYWTTGNIPPSDAGSYFPARPLSVPKTNLSEKDVNSNLRSFIAVEGYNIRAIDDTFGHVEDIIIDDADWQLVYLIVDTSNWLPWSKKVMLAINWLDEISYVDREVKINLNTETIKDAPDFNTNQPIEMAYEESLSEYYQRNLKL